jgi:hypothetical protein
LLEHPNEAVVLSTLEALASFNQSEAVPVIIEALQNQEQKKRGLRYATPG